MVNKKAFMRTLEVVAAVVVTFIFVIYIIPQAEPIERRDQRIEILAQLKDNPDFLSCIAETDQDCISQILRENIPKKYDFEVLITSNPKESISDLPKKEVYVDSIFLVGSPENTIVKVYYWLR